MNNEFTASIKENTPSRIVLFLRGEAKNSDGKTIHDICKFTTQELEETHDYIQWLFPLVEWSEMVPGSPYLEPEDIEMIKSDELIQENILQSLSLMHHFYETNDHWLQKGDHNHYRISRIIRSVVLLNKKENAEEFYQAILDRVEEKMPVTFESLEYWKDGLA